ncbi:MAG TPA: MBL fold metallo-hydrolase [Streptosporangiaceae bacterium]|nr:MBL fold metallo-hydrolase [Streptosporangiaceae bacterium]
MSHPAPSPVDGTGTPRARCVLAPNPSPMTLDGTNTWLLADPGSTQAVVVDPGPNTPHHLARIQSEAEAAGQHITHILLTHTHPDHAEAAATFSAQTKAPVLAVDPAYHTAPRPLVPESVLDVAGLEIRVIPTPGHTQDSICLHLLADQALLTGDTVLGRGTTVIAQDGNLAAYMASLAVLRSLCDEAELSVLLPGHGPVLTNPAATLDFYMAHRRERLAEVEAALAAGDRTPQEIVARVYADVDPSLWRFAEWSVRAQLEYLNNEARLPTGVKW